MNWETERSSRCDTKDMCLCIIEGIRMMTRISRLRFTGRDYTIPAMKKFAIAFLLLASLVSAQQNKPVKVPPPGTNGAGAGDVKNVPPSTEPPKSEPVISDATHAKIRDLQLQQKTVEAQYLQLQSQLKGMENQYNALGVQITKAMDEAYKESNVRPEEWSLQPDTLKFTKIEKPKAEPPKK